MRTLKKRGSYGVNSLLARRLIMTEKKLTASEMLAFFRLEVAYLDFMAKACGGTDAIQDYKARRDNMAKMVSQVVTYLEAGGSENG